MDNEELNDEELAIAHLMIQNDDDEISQDASAILQKYKKRKSKFKTNILNIRKIKKVMEIEIDQK